jgi:glucose-1-phosphate thymidylyltransferase
MSMPPKGIILLRAAAGAPGHPGAGLPAAELVANRPIVAHVAEVLRRAGAEEVAIVGAPSAVTAVRRLTDPALVPARFITVEGRHDLFGMLCAAVPFVGAAPCVVHAGEGLTDTPLAAGGELAGGDRPDVAIFLYHARGQCDPLSQEIQHVFGLADLHPARAGLAVAGVSLFGPGALQHACAHEGGSGEDSAAAVVSRIAAAGGQTHVGRVGGWHRFAGDQRDLLDLNRMVLDRLQPGAEFLDPADNRIEGRVEIHPSARIEGSVLSGPVIVGADARIVDSYVGPYSTVGEGAELDGAEIERSIVGAGAQIRHVGVRIEGSTIGPGARISRDFALPRAVRMHVGAGVELVLD